MSEFSTIERHFKQISIRGRVEFGVCCIEQFIEENNIKEKWLDLLTQILWDFTTSDRLDIWESKISSLEPINILDKSLANNASDYEDLSEDDFNELKKLYSDLPPDLIEMIDWTIHIGGSNLYGGTGEYSKASLDPTLEVYKIATVTIKTLPDVNKFLISKYEEANGWGNKIDKSKFK